MTRLRCGQFVLASIALACFATPAAHAGITLVPFYRWASAPVTSCVDSGGLMARLESQPIQWGSLSATDLYTVTNAFNGVAALFGPYDPPDGTGSTTFSAFQSDVGAPPFAFRFQYDTLLGGTEVAYSSALATACTGIGSATSVVIDWVAAQQAQFYRWTQAPKVTCTSVPGMATLSVENQPVEWRNLASNSYEVIVSSNGVETTTGPFPAPDGNGATILGAVGQTEPGYPIHVAVRLDTALGSGVVYESVFTGNCTADGPGTSAVHDVPEPDGAASSPAPR